MRKKDSDASNIIIDNQDKVRKRVQQSNPYIEHDSKAPRVYQLAQLKKKASLGDLTSGSSQGFAYKGNVHDLQPFFKREGKNRLAANESQVQYAANLRNYHPVDYEKIPQRLERELNMNGSKDSLHSLDGASPEQKMKMERSRINRMNNGFTSQKNLARATPSFNLDIHERQFETNIVSGKKRDVAFLPPIRKDSPEK